SRTDPPLPLALLRGRGQLLELRLSDLRFSDTDAETYLNGGVGLNLAAPLVQALNHKAEGWIAGLQMAALAMRDLAAPDPARTTEFVASFSGSNRFILDYLIEEVLNRQPEAIQDFLIRTSILEQLCPPLCDALLLDGGVDAQSALQHLESSNLFVVPLDQQRYWYRYHHLFADLLRKRLAQSPAAAVEELHRRAAAWYEQNGLVPNAIHHAFAMKDHHKAAALVVQVTAEMWGRGEHVTLLAWMDALPDEEKKAYPPLLTYQVSMLISMGRLREAEACIPLLEEYIQSALQADPPETALIGSVFALRTYIASFHTDWQAVVAHAQTALEHLVREEDAGQRCGVELVLGNALLNLGSLTEAARVLADAIVDAKKSRKPHMTLSGLANLGVLWFSQGRLSRAASCCQEALQLIEQYGFERSSMAVDVRLVWGGLLTERGALAEAEEIVRKGTEMAREQQFIWQAARGQQRLARLLLAQGRLVEAEAAAQAATQSSEAHPLPAYIACPGAALLAELWLRQGRLAEAGRHLQARQITLEGDITFPRQAEYLALARLRWLQGDRSGASQGLARIAEWAGANGQTGTQLAALLLHALICQADDRQVAGLAYLAQALTLAEPEGIVQPFVDEGDAMRTLLRAAQEQGIQPGYAARLLAAFPAAMADAEPVKPAQTQPERPKIKPESTALIEPLSPREMETLQYIAGGLSNKEIAQKMFISLRTVKYYSTGLYNKLGVDSRMQAVVRARELGLLD
ncbi:MAG: hypothetical protein HY835_04660, partial [Anaerolineae bacterium]|nr:hypothetical protein [Anaerolineae bacterium]